MGRSIFRIVLVLAAVVCVSSPAWARVWTDRYGNSISARFVRVHLTDVVLQRGGKSVTIPIMDLCEEDQEYVRRLQAGEIADEDSPADRTPALKPAETAEGSASADAPSDEAPPDANASSAAADEDSPWAEMPVRAWTDYQGRQLEASFAGVRDTDVRLRKDGKTLSFPYKFFSVYDQRYVRDTLEKAGQGDLIAGLLPPNPNAGRSSSSPPGGMTFPNFPSGPSFGSQAMQRHQAMAEEQQRRQAEFFQRMEEQNRNNAMSSAPAMSPGFPSQQSSDQPPAPSFAPSTPSYTPPSYSPPSAPSGPQFEMVKYCTKCKGVLPDSIQVGDRCPHCKAYLAYGEQNGQFYDAKGRQISSWWIKAGGGAGALALGIGIVVMIIRALLR